MAAVTSLLASVWSLIFDVLFFWQMVCSPPSPTKLSELLADTLAEPLALAHPETTGTAMV